MKLLALGLFCLTALTGASAPATHKVGVYDSRLVAYAHFWSEFEVRAREARFAQAKAAKSSGDTATHERLSQEMRDLQRQIHLQVFSTAPAEEAMAALADRLPALQRELGVARLVSKWDDPALSGVAEANRVDVTDALVRALFTPNEKQAKTLASMKTTKPLPLDRARQLEGAGKL